MSEIWRLYELQRADGRIAEAERALAALRSDDAHRQQFAAVEARFQEADGEFRRLKKELREMELEDQTLRDRRKSLEGKLYGGRISNPKELASFEEELKHVQARLDALEDDMLARMEDLEQRESTVAELQRELEQEQGRRDQRQSEIAAQAAAHEQELASVKERRRRMATETPAADLKRYEELRAKKHGVAVAKVEGTSCGGCRMHLTDHKIQQARGADMTWCSTCGRILYAET